MIGRLAAAAAAILLLSGCAGSIFSGAGTSAAGGGLASSKHVDGHDCPDFTVQGALQVTSMTASCSSSPAGGHTETFSAAGLDPNQALATAFQAQTAQNAQLMQALGQLLPLLTTAAGAAIGVPISPVRPPPTPINPPIVLTPPGGGAPVVIPQ